MENRKASFISNLRVRVVMAAIGIYGVTHIAWGSERGGPAILLGATALVTVVAGMSCDLPAGRAARVNPPEALRSE